jgi:hypothetical protein
MSEGVRVVGCLGRGVLTTVVLHVLDDMLSRRIAMTEVIDMTIGQIGSEILPVVIIQIFLNPNDKVPRVRRRNFGPLYRRRSRLGRGRRNLDLLCLGGDVIIDYNCRQLGRDRSRRRRGSRKFGRCGCIDEVTVDYFVRVSFGNWRIRELTEIVERAVRNNFIVESWCVVLSIP